MIILCLTFWGTAKVLPGCWEHFTSPSAVCTGTSFSTSLPTLVNVFFRITTWSRQIHCRWLRTDPKVLWHQRQTDPGLCKIWLIRDLVTRPCDLGQRGGTNIMTRTKAIFIHTGMCLVYLDHMEGIKQVPDCHNTRVWSENLPLYGFSLVWIPTLRVWCVPSVCLWLAFP